MKERIFLKIGGSFITDKTIANSFKAKRVQLIARAIVRALTECEIELLLAHGAGSFGHIKAKEFDAQDGIHPIHDWRAFYEIRNDMIRMNQQFIQICNKEGLFPITVQPSAIITSSGGKIGAIDCSAITYLMQFNQIPVVHGDIVVDSVQGFTIASTEDILAALAEQFYFDRVLMVSDVAGVLDVQRKVIPEINESNYHDIMHHLGSARGADVTGGMRNKVSQLYHLVRNERIGAAHVLTCENDPDDLKNILMAKKRLGTYIR